MRNITKTKNMMRMKQMTKRTICKISIAIIITSVLAAIVLPRTYTARGYWDIGGEWILLVLVFILSYKCA